MADAPIELVDYDPAWLDAFLAERRALEGLLAPWLAGPIEHVGSTAVPGLAAKPVIDIAAAVRTLDDARPAIAALRALQYVHFPYRPDVEHWFCKPSPERRTHHLHLVPFASALWTERLAFRDHLRAHPDAAREYVALKRALAERHRLDREAYTDGKGAFVARIVARTTRERP